MTIKKRKTKNMLILLEVTYKIVEHTLTNSQNLFKFECTLRIFCLKLATYLQRNLNIAFVKLFSFRYRLAADV